MTTTLDRANLFSQQYVVTFNDLVGTLGTYRVGNIEMKSIDYFGPDMAAMATVVIDHEAKSDFAKRPAKQRGTLSFNQISETRGVVGLFYDANRKLIAIMYKWV